jgi:hypothetical protein
MSARRPSGRKASRTAEASEPAIRPGGASPGARSALCAKYRQLAAKHDGLVRRAEQQAEGRLGLVALGLFALRATGAALALADGEHVLLRNGRWHVIERDRTAWRATARDPAAPPGAPTLDRLATAAARTLLSRGAPAIVVGRYERPARGDVFDVRFERLTDGRKRAVGVHVLDVTRLVVAERELRSLGRPPRS